MVNLKNWLILAAVMALATSAFAQNPGPKSGPPKPGAQAGQEGKRPGGMRMGFGMSDQVLAKLNLTSAQKQKVEALRTKLRAEMEKMRAANGPNNRPDREKMRAVFEKYQKEFMAILTPEQKKKLEAERKAMMEKFRKEGGPGGPGGKPGAKSGGGKGG